MSCPRRHRCLSSPDYLRKPEAGMAVAELCSHSLPVFSQNESGHIQSPHGLICHSKQVERFKVFSHSLSPNRTSS